MTDSHEKNTTTLSRLMGFLEADPDNASLLRDAAEAALEAGEPQTGLDLVTRLEALQPLDPAAQNLAGLAALQAGDYASACTRFGDLLQHHPRDHALRFNLAWARAMTGDAGGALATLDDETIAALPQAAMLDVQLRHERGEFDGAAQRARFYAEQHPGDAGLAAAASVLALDIKDKAFARAMAVRGGDHPDALTTLGTLALAEQKTDEARALFDRALERNDASPRAWLGRGLAGLTDGNAAEAARALDRGAELFETHLGSWIAAGWAWLIAGDLATARARFRHACDLDDTFAECHGSLAVIAVMDGDLEAGETLRKTALRLDRECFSAAFAGMLARAAAGDEAAAKAIFQRAIDTPVSPDGETVAMALARLNIAVD